ACAGFTPRASRSCTSCGPALPHDRFCLTCTHRPTSRRVGRRRLRYCLCASRAQALSSSRVQCTTSVAVLRVRSFSPLSSLPPPGCPPPGCPPPGCSPPATRGHPRQLLRRHTPPHLPAPRRTTTATQASRRTTTARPAPRRTTTTTTPVKPTCVPRTT